MASLLESVLALLLLVGLEHGDVGLVALLLCTTSQLFALARFFHKIIKKGSNG